uniref:Extracellular globin-2A n=1 Tax=Tylorrhynchus heterochetus TaxID=3228785 RepID=GLB2_TYLHE|nr:RecName: Full=Extracellular globin-2A; AltName: Full=Erythrocruorin; AltName: Full=Globin IIA [Tylorrhynchus heterochaetus]
SSDHCGPLQRLKVKQQWAKAYGVGHERVELGIALWKSMFAQDNDARDLFKRVHGEDVHSPAFEAHMARVFNGLDRVISSLTDEPVLNAQLEHLRQQHIKLGITGHMFNLMRTGLAYVLPAQLGRCFDKEAWAACWDEVIYPGIKHD